MLSLTTPPSPMCNQEHVKQQAFWRRIALLILQNTTAKDWKLPLIQENGSRTGNIFS